MMADSFRGVPFPDVGNGARLCEKSFHTLGHFFAGQPARKNGRNRSRRELGRERVLLGRYRLKQLA